MTNSKTYFFFVLALIVSALSILGAIGGDCVADCKESGHALALCYNICRP